MFFFTQRRMLLFDLIILSNNIIERDTKVKRKGKKRNVSFSRVAGTVSLPVRKKKKVLSFIEI